MGDRVACICGSTPGWDHFPFPVAYSPGSGPSDFDKEGFAVNLDQAMKWYWRVKKWRIEAYVEMEVVGIGDNPICSISGDFDVTAATLLSGKVPTREADLVIPTNLFQAFTNVDDDGVMNVYYNPTSMTKQAGDNFFFPFLIHAYNEASETCIQNTDRDLEEGGPAPDTSGDDMVNCDDVTNFGYYFRGTGGPLVTGYINITPVEFWPYATKGGLPVWDTSTGAMINTPD